MADPTVATVNAMIPYNATRSTHPKYATKDDWEEHREFIGKLCSIAPLKKVMDFMEEAHNFKATEKMYKQRLTKWGLDKKGKEREMKSIVRKYKQRSDLGKDSMIRVRGRTIKWETVVHYWNRKHMSIEEVFTRRRSSPTPDAVECLTPVPSPVTPPSIQVIPERIVCTIKGYVQGSFQSGTWVKPNEPNEWCYSSKDSHGYAVDILNAFVDTLYFVCNLFRNGQYKEAGQELVSVTARIKGLLVAEHPETISRLLQTIAAVRRKGRDEICSAILREFSSLGEIFLGTRHPLYLICNWLNVAEKPQVDYIVTIAYETIADYLDSELGPLSATALGTRLRYIKDIIGRRSFVQKGSALETLAHAVENYCGIHDERTLQVYLFMAGRLILDGQY